MAERLFILAPTVVLAARVNLVTATYPISWVPVDGITSGALANVKSGMTLMIGSAAGKDDYGRQRVKEVSGSSIKVGRSSQGINDGELNVADNAYVTVLDDHRIWSKSVRIDPDGTVYKDGDLSDGATNTVQPPPIPIGGPGFAGTANAGTGVATVNFDGSNSIQFDPATSPFVSGASGHSWNVKDGTITVGTSTSAAITATFPPGFRWVEYTATTSVGMGSKTATQYIPVFVRHPTVENSIQYFQVAGQSRTLGGGQTLDIDIYQDLPASTYPDGTLVMLWEDSLQSADVSRPHVEFIGWMDRVEFGASYPDYKQKLTQIRCIDTAGRLAQLPGFSQIVVKPYHEIRVTEDAPVGATSIFVEEPGVTIPNTTVLEVFGKPGTIILTAQANSNTSVLQVSPTTFEIEEGDYIAYPKALPANWSETRFNTIYYYVYYLLQWHSNALEVVNLRDIDWSLMAFKFVRFASDQATLWEQVTKAATRAIPDRHLNVNRLGEIIVVRDPLIQHPDDRSATVAETITSNEWISFQVSRNRSPRAYEIVLWATDNESINFSALRAKAPGKAIGMGAQQIEINENIVDGEFDLAYTAGNRYARLNAPFEKFKLSVPGGKFPLNFDLAYMEWVNIVIDANNQSLRGLLNGSTFRGIVHEMSIQRQYEDTGIVYTYSLTWEMETSGFPGIIVED